MEYKLIFTAVIAGITVPFQSYGNQVPGKKPNVVIILTDDMGYGDISCYNANQVRTPNIDRLATDGVLFSDFYVPTPYSAPSRATLLTGRFPLRHGLIQNPAPDAGINDVGLSSTEETMGEIFQKAGYKTKCIGKWHLGHKEEFFPVKHGFNEYYGILYSNDMRPIQIIENMDTVEYPVDQRLLTKKYTARAVEFIKRNKENPFFLYLAHAMPHKPLAASENFYSHGNTAGQLYSDVIRELDWSAGEIMSELASSGILENTIVVFMSDNGPWYGGNTGGLKGMKATNWEGGTRVPFIIRFPKMLPKNKIVETPCWSPDVLPTLMRLSGIGIDPDLVLDGSDITEIMQGKKKEHGPVYTMKNDRIITIRDGKWKLFVEKPEFYKEVDLTKWTDWRGPDGKTILAPAEQSTPANYPGVKPLPLKGETLLFNLKKDRSEQNDLSAEYPEIVIRLRKEYEIFRNKF